MSHNVVIRGFNATLKIIGRGFARYSTTGRKVCLCRLRDIPYVCLIPKDKPYICLKTGADEMNHVIGSAVKIECEVSPTTGSSLTLQSLMGPLGDEILSEIEMEFDSENPEIAATIFQTTEGVHALGRYTYLLT